MTVGGGGGDDDRNDLLAAIRGGGGGLKKASDRAPPPELPPGESGGGMSDLLKEIQKGRNLKKVVVQEKAPVAPTTMGGLSVAAILARRAALDGDESSTDDSEWED